MASRSGPYTMLGTAIWTWHRFTALKDHGRLIYLALYTTVEAKRIVPGLFHGSITAIAEAAAMPVDRTKVALDHLLEHELIEYDMERRVLRLTELPDHRESPPNGNVIRGWYTRFCSVPQCDVRDAHVKTLLWLMEEWQRVEKKPLSDKHVLAWSETFAAVDIPVPRKRGKKRLKEPNIGTLEQPSLFGLLGSGNGSDDGSDPVLLEGGCDSGGATPEQKNNNENAPVKPFRNGLGNRSDQDQDQDLDLSSSLGREPDPGRELIPIVDAADHPLHPANAGDGRVRLQLVPPVAPYDDMLLAVSEGSQGRFTPMVRNGVHDALASVWRAAAASGVTRDDLVLAGRWIARTASTDLASISGDPRSRLSAFLAVPGNLELAIRQAKEHDRAAAEASAHLAELRKQLPT